MLNILNPARSTLSPGILSRCLHQAIIDNTPVTTTSTFTSVNPATGQVVGEISDCTRDETLQSIESARRCFLTFRRTSPAYRANLLTEWADLITANASTVAELTTQEMGKPISEALGEVTYGVSFLYHFAGQIKTGLTGETLTPGQPHWRPVNIRQPVGPVATITPWNFPVAMITRKVGAAIAAGCTVINAPSEDTPLVALYLAQLAVQAGFPEGLFNVIPSSRENKQGIGELLCTHSDISALSFTGSTTIGKLLTKQCASTVKRVHLELGGNAPFIVFDSADIDRAVKGAMLAKFKNAGQACNAANRIFVHRSVYNEFFEKLAKQVLALKVGDGAQSGVHIGPLVNKKGHDKVSRIVDGSMSHCSDRIIGEKTDSIPFYSPSLLSFEDKTDVSIFHEEIFGPIAAVYQFESEEEVVALANNTRYGLQAYVFTRDLAQSWRVSEELEYGMVAVNEGAISSANNPFGGWKESGVGREAGHFGVHQFTEDKLICFGL